MVYLSSGFDSPIEHGFNNTIFVIPAIIVIGLADISLPIDIIRLQVLAEGNRMWMILASGLMAISLTIADDAATVAPEVASDAVPSLDEIPNFNGEIPTPEQLLEVLDSMAGISDEEKSKLREELLKTIGGGGGFPEPITGSNITMQTVILLSLLSLVALIFVFFVYKLFKVLSERQTKREEKKKIKQMKKKK